MLDFPNTPVLNQTFFGANNIVYVWDGVKWVASAQGVAAGPYAPLGSLGVGRNLVHNSLFNIQQRGAGPFTTLTGLYTLDRWWMQGSGGTMSITPVTLVDADRAAIGDESAENTIQAVVTGGAAGANYAQIVHPIEDLYRTSNKTVTASFWAKANTGTPKIGINFNQFFGTGGSPSAAVNTAGQAVTISTTWARYSVTQAIPSVAGKVMGTAGQCVQLQIWLSSGTTNAGNAGLIGVQSGTFTIWGVQLEVGSVATPLEKPDPRYDLANCQRFYFASTAAMAGFAVTGYAGASTTLQMIRTVPVIMRVQTPVVTTSGVVLNNVSSASYQGYSDGIFGVATAGVGPYAWTGAFTMSADL